jgi:hypothetical protein
MNNEEKLAVFEKHLNMIQSETIRDFTKYCLVRFPPYFWTLPSSTSGRRHGGAGETLIDHIQGCLYLAECVIRQMERVWTQRQKDQLISALILHDGWRCNVEGEERRYTEEMLAKKGIEEQNKLLGQLCTDPEHPEIGYREVLRLALDYNQEYPQHSIAVRDLDIISRAVRLHYGPWTRTPNVPFSLDWPFSSVVVQCHLIDYQQACNSKYFNGLKNE